MRAPLCFRGLTVTPHCENLCRSIRTAASALCAISVVGALFLIVAILVWKRRHEQSAKSIISDSLSRLQSLLLYLTIADVAYSLAMQLVWDIDDNYYVCQVQAVAFQVRSCFQAAIPFVEGSCVCRSDVPHGRVRLRDLLLSGAVPCPGAARVRERAPPDLL